MYNVYDERKPCSECHIATVSYGISGRCPNCGHGKAEFLVRSEQLKRNKDEVLSPYMTERARDKERERAASKERDKLGHFLPE